MRFRPDTCLAKVVPASRHFVEQVAGALARNERPTGGVARQWRRSRFLFLVLSSVETADVLLLFCQEFRYGRLCQGLKAKIEEKELIPPDEQKLVFGNEVLEDGCTTLADLTIQHESTLHLVLRLLSPGMHISVKTLIGTHINLEVLSSYTISHLRVMIQNWMGYHRDDQRIVFDGKQLETGHSLSDCNIQNGSTIHVVCPFGQPRTMCIRTLRDDTISLKFASLDITI
ncbi:polyubiquitin 11-like [Lolium perenne]|uniref:polyubiquitin 11-like n=1 Tax=Lolium perenne TaxID=4522 RepID=UPI0021F523A2|nr:uncharacterized protein LOC127310205 [Lolium perenne]